MLLQVWQWLRHGAVVDGQQPLMAARFDQLLKEEMAKLRRCRNPFKPFWQAGWYIQRQPIMVLLLRKVCSEGRSSSNCSGIRQGQS